MKRMKKGLKIIAVLGMTLIILVTAALVGPYALQLKPYAVLSGSMQPVYPTGSLIYVQKTEPDQITVGTPITFTRSGMVVTHRVVQTDSENRVFYTKGDANSIQDDGVVPYQNLIGKPVLDIPYLGYAAVYLSSISGKITLITVFLCLLILTVLSDVIRRQSSRSFELKTEMQKKEGESG